MSDDMRKDIKTVSDLKKNTDDIFRQMHRTGRPVIVTVGGKPDAVLLDVDVFERKLKSINLAVLLARAEADVKKGRTRDAHEFLKELNQRAKLSR